MNTEAFMAKLKALCEEYRVAVSGCGCCHSPYLVPWGQANEVYVDFAITEEGGNPTPERSSFPGDYWGGGDEEDEPE